MKQHMKWLILAGVGLSVVACQDFQPSKRDSFKARYLNAREALEDGQYSRATRGYQVLLKVSGPHEPRVRLEYAHALLRADKFAAAADQARALSSTQSGDTRLAALAVEATANHEIARAAMRQGDRGSNTRARLQAAYQGLGEVLKKGKVFDPLGALADRRRIIKRELSSL